MVACRPAPRRLDLTGEQVDALAAFSTRPRWRRWLPGGVSPRTVAYHLYKAFPKLGVASRAELAKLVS